MATFYSNISSYYQLRLDISQASQDITNNTSSVYYKLTLTSGYSSFAKWGHIRWLIINGATVYSETSQIAIGAQSSLVLAEGYTTVSHNSDGTKTVSFSASFDSGGSRPAYIVQTALVLSGTLALTTIPRASMISRTYASRELGETQTFSISRASGSFTHTVRYRIGSGGWTNIATGVATSQTWTLPASLASSVTNNTKATITVECLTYNGGTHIGTSSTSFEMTIPNNSTYQPNVSINSGYPSIVNPLGGVAVQGKSKIRVVSSYSGNYGATIASVRATINGVNYSGQDVTSAVINATGNVPVTVTVTDTRGYSKTTAPVNVNFVAYSNPSIETFTAVRYPTSMDTGVRIKVKFNIDSVNNKNTTSYSIKYTPLGGATVTVVSSSSVYSVDETIDLLSGTALANTAYIFHLQVDDHYNSISRTVVFGKAFELINYPDSGEGMAFGAMYDSDLKGILQVYATQDGATRFVSASDESGMEPILGETTHSSMVLTNLNNKYGLNFVVTSSGHTMIQGQRFDGDGAQSYNIVLQPKGGDVYIGDDIVNVKDSKWVTPTLINGWVMHNSTYGTLQYRKIGDVVYLRGIIKNSSNSSGAFFTMPPGYRPAISMVFPGVTEDKLSDLYLTNGGVCTVSGSFAGKWVTLSGICFATG